MASGFVTAVPVPTALAVAGRPVCGPRLASCLPILSISAASRRTVRELGTGLLYSTGRTGRGVSQALDRPRPWVVLPTGRSVRCGSVCSTGNKPRAWFGVVPTARPGARWSVVPAPATGALETGGTGLHGRRNEYRPAGPTGRNHVPAMKTGVRVVSAPEQGTVAADRRAGRLSPSDRSGARRSLLSTGVLLCSTKSTVGRDCVTAALQRSKRNEGCNRVCSRCVRSGHGPRRLWRQGGR